MVDQLCKTPEYLVDDKGYDFDVLRTRLKERDIELVAPPRRNKRIKLQDGRAPRRYRRSWKIERTIAWFGNFRRLITRWERNDRMFLISLATRMKPLLESVEGDERMLLDRPEDKQPSAAGMLYDVAFMP